MTSGVVDLISQNPGDLVRRELARDAAAHVVASIFRLVKVSTVHAAENQAVIRQVDETAQAVSDYGQRTGVNLSILFAHRSVFVGGQLLRGNRSVYESAAELGELIGRAGASELTIARDARPADLAVFAAALGEAFRSGKASDLASRSFSRVRLSPVGEGALRRGVAIEDLSPDAAVVRTYASAVVIMRRFHESLLEGRYELARRIKRVAQNLVDLSAGETPAFLGVTAARNANRDEAGRAVNTAILSLAMARQITSDAVTLLRLAMAALLFEAGRPRLAGARPGIARPAILPELGDREQADLPAGTAAVVAALGRVNEPGVMRLVIDYEAQWVRHRGRLGPLYRGLRQPLLQARIVAVARAFNDLLTPAPGAPPMNADRAIATVTSNATESADKTVVRLLIGALGIFPTGTLVELSTGEVALVVQTPAHPARYSQPRVRLVFDAHGGAIANTAAADIDLAEPPAPGEPTRHVVRIVSTADEGQVPPLPARAPSSTAQPSTPPLPRTPAAAMPAPRTAAPTTPATSGPAMRRAGSNPEIARAGSNPGIARAGSNPEIARAGSNPEIARAGSNPGIARAGSNPEITPARTASREDEMKDDNDSATRAMAWRDQAYLLPPDTTAAAEEIPSEDQSSRPTLPPQPTGGPVPTAEGNLTRTPLVHLFVYMLDQRLTGTTVFHPSHGPPHALYFVEGAPAKVRTGGMVAPLDRVLLELGLVDEPTLRSTLLEVSKAKILHGKHLVAKGLLDRETLLGALRLQLVRKVEHLFEMPPQTRYAYYDGVNLLASWGGAELTPCEPLALILVGVRQRADDPLVDATLERISGRVVGIAAGVDMRRFDLDREERAVCDILRARRMTLADLLRAGAAPERVVRTTMYALAITRHLDLGVPGRPPVGALPDEAESIPEPHRSAPARSGAAPAQAAAASTAPPVSAARPSAQGAVRRTETQVSAHPSPFASTPSDKITLPAPPASSVGAKAPSATGLRLGGAPGEATSSVPPAKSSEPGSRLGPADAAERRAQIEHRLATIGGENFFELLGVTADASHDQIQRAYFALAKVWHPDRLPAELADLRTDVSRAFARLNDAFQTLGDPQMRAEYKKRLDAGKATPDEEEKVARVLNAALEFQKAEVLLKKHDLAGAEQMATRAAHADPDQPEYLTMLAWIQSLRRIDPPRHEGTTVTTFDDLIKTLDKVLAREPRFERAIFYRGMLQKRAGRVEHAFKDFKLAAEINPKNLDAVREVRVFEMRKKKTGPSSGDTPPPPPASGGGLLGKFFKK